jgi:hypothetical protein
LKQRFISAARTAAPLVLMLAVAATEAHAQGGASGNAGLDKAYTFFQTLLVWLRNVAFLVFIGTLVWGCIECAAESWRDGRGKVFTSIGCGIIAGIAQALITGVYSTNG